MRNIILIIMVLITTNVFASVDYSCVNDCTAKGYSYGYCRDFCSYEPYKLPEPIKQVDYKCQSECLKKGYTYQYCNNLCSY